MKTDTPEAQALIAAVRAALDATTRELAPKLDAAGVKDPDSRLANEMQNVLRLCMEVCLKERIGYSEELPVQLALRLASYAISALPDREQRYGVSYVLGNLESVHFNRLAAGIRISTEWVRTSPAKGTVQ